MYYNVILRSLRITIVAVENIMSVSIFALVIRHVNWIFYVHNYTVLWPVWFYYIFYINLQKVWLPEKYWTYSVCITNFPKYISF
jgi:hypothetical protein